MVTQTVLVKVVIDSYFVRTVLNRQNQIVPFADEADIGLFQTIGKTYGIGTAFTCIVIGNRVLPKPFAKDIGIVAFAAVQTVVACPAYQGIITFTAVKVGTLVIAQAHILQNIVTFCTRCFGE